jgi:carboxymethylenebutenolidase
MARKTADDFHPQALQLFDQFVHGGISRRDFLARIPKYALLGLSAEAVLDVLCRNFAEAQQIAPDALYPLGGYPGDEDKVRELFQKLDKNKTQNDFNAAFPALKTLPGGNAKAAAIGFCYGAQPGAEDAAQIKAALLIHYAEKDERINAGWPAYEAALHKAEVNYEAPIYPDVQHGFNNDTRPRYDAAATAKLAWDRSIGFFNVYLRAS